MSYIEKIVNVETGEVTERPYTDLEIAEVEAKKDALEKWLTEKAKSEAAKTALLEKLGITEEEAKLLFS